MNVNGSRFHLLLGETDWERCLATVDDDGTANVAWRRLAAWWSAALPASPPAAGSSSEAESAPFSFDPMRKELRLQSVPIKLVNPGEASPTLEARRAAAADRYGNIYWIDGDRRRLRVWSVGSAREGAFWPDGPTGSAAAHDGADFGPPTAAPAPERRFAALAVTEDHYLVAAFVGPSANGLLAFDLMAGGPPLETLWPAAVALTPFDMASRHGGGVWLLDRVNARLWEFDRRLAVVSRGQREIVLAPGDLAVFQPANGPPRPQTELVFPGGIDLAAITHGPIDPISVEALPDDGVFILDRNDTHGRSRVFHLKRSGDALTVDPPVWLSGLAHDFVLGTAAVIDTGTSPVRLFVASATNHQAWAFAVTAPGQPFGPRETAELFPLRRFGGRALLAVRGAATYDSGSLRWVPVVQQPRRRYREQAELITPVFDGLELQCVWDRLMLDAAIGADCEVEVSCRVSDELAPAVDMTDGTPPIDEVIGGWIAQPQPYLRSDGAELPWLRAQAMRRTRRNAGAGTWELLLQGARGRYLQLRLRLSGNGTATPWLRALRAWYPRFSYPQRFLPAVYREDASARDFIDRFLANVEGINTSIEERIVRVQALLDSRTAPAESLAWLAGWFDIALDPSWEDWRRRLFIRHAMDFFQWRGTIHGLRLALALATQRRLDDSFFDAPDLASTRPQSIRIVEAYQTRLIGALAAGDAGGAESGLRAISPGALWTPQEGNAGLVERYARFRGGTATAAEQMSPFALTPPDDASLSTDGQAQLQARWRAFCEFNLGFVPSAGADERRRWQSFRLARHAGSSQSTADLPADWPSDPQLADDWFAFCGLPPDSLIPASWRDFLARRYRRIERLNAAYHTAWPSFDLVALPDRVPASAAAQADWLQFERQVLAMVRTAHRFSVLLPMSSVTENPDDLQRRLALMRRIVALEKPAHTVFDVRFYWALNRIGEARLGLDTLIDVGSRAPQLMPDVVLGRAYVGESFVGGRKPPIDGDRRLLSC